MRLFGFRPRGSPPPALASSDSGGVPGSRPTTVLGFLSDLAKSPEQARTLALTVVFTAGALLLIATGCFALACFTVAMAAREVHGVPATAIVSTGFGGASVLTFVVALIRRMIRKPSTADRSDGGAGKPSDTRP
jgi:hypothetical protein